MESIKDDLLAWALRDDDDNSMEDADLVAANAEIKEHSGRVSPPSGPGARRPQQPPTMLSPVPNKLIERIFSTAQVDVRRTQEAALLAFWYSRRGQSRRLLEIVVGSIL